LLDFVTLLSVAPCGAGRLLGLVRTKCKEDFEE